MADGTLLFSPAVEDEVLAKARDEIARSHHLQQRALEGQVLPDAVRQACDVTLSHMGLTSLPPELIDVIKNDVARLALDNNRLPGLSGLSMRLAECSRLRYLVMRNNQLREFPTSILQVPTLELLDLKGNKITSLPEDLSRLRNLRVFSVYHNRISKIPLCVGQMNSLVHFAARRNPISFPRPEEWIMEDPDMDPRDKIKEDQRIRTETKNLKAALVAYSNRERLKAEGDSELSEENVETPRPTRRKTSGRFPIKPSLSATDLKDESALISPPLISPPLQKPPPMPLKPAAKLPAQPQNTITRPSVAPLVSSNNERNRSNSESQMSTSLRAKRFGIITKKTAAQSNLESDQNKRLSHLRGLSHGSALQNGASPDGTSDTVSPASPTDGDQRATFTRRLSSLPEGKRRSHMHDPIVELARGVTYALEQISAPIKSLISVVKDSRKTNLDRLYQLGLTSVEELDQLLSKVTLHDEESDEVEKSTSLVRVTCENCLTVYQQLIAAVLHDIKGIITLSSQQRIRTLMHMLYASLIEIRNACSKLGVEFQSTPRPAQQDVQRGRYLSPAPNRPLTSMRVRDQTPVLPGSRPGSHARYAPLPPVPISAPLSAASRSGSMVSLNSALRDSFAPFGNGAMPTAPTSRMSRSNTLMSVDEGDEEAQFENIYLKLTAACDFAVQALPRCQVLLTESTRMAAERGSGEADIANYEVIVDRCKIAMDAADALRRRLSSLRLKEPGIRTNLDFWQLCTSFIRAYFMFAGRVKDCYSSPVTLLPEDIKLLLKPLQRSVKDVSKAINDSAWGSLAATPGQQPLLAANKSMTNIAGMNAANYETNASSQQIRGHIPAHSRTHTYTQQQRQHPQLSLSTRNMPMPLANSLEPLSASSNHSASGGDSFSFGLGVAGLGGMNGVNLASGSGYATPIPAPAHSSKSVMQTNSTMPTTATSGVSSVYITPLPATPLSAALGPAAGATVPLPVSIPLSNLATGPNGVSGSIALGGLLPTAAMGVGAGILAAAPTALHGSGTVSGIMAPSSTNMGHISSGGTATSSGMVAGLQGYLSAAGAVPVSGLPVLSHTSAPLMAPAGVVAMGMLGPAPIGIGAMGTSVPPPPPVPQMPASSGPFGTPMERTRSLSQRR